MAYEQHNGLREQPLGELLKRLSNQVSTPTFFATGEPRYRLLTPAGEVVSDDLRGAAAALNIGTRLTHVDGRVFVVVAVSEPRNGTVEITVDGSTVAARDRLLAAVGDLPLDVGTRLGLGAGVPHWPHRDVGPRAR